MPKKELYVVLRSLFRESLPAEMATFKDALSLRYNAAQRLFNGEEKP
jgi:hypothetical protein